MAGTRRNFFTGLAARFRSSASPTVSVGSSGDSVSYGYVVSKEKSPSLQGQQKYKTYSELLVNTTVIGTGVRYFLMLLSSAKWNVIPAQDEDGNPLPGAEEVAAFVESCMEDMDTPWRRVVRRAAMYRFYGFSVQEWVAKKRDDGRLGISAVETRPQHTICRWDVEPGGKILGLVQQTQEYGEVYIPRSKFIHVVDDTLEESPEGIGLLRHLVRPAERLRAYEELEEIGFSTDLRGIPVGYGPLTDMREQVKAGTMKVEDVEKARGAINRFLDNHMKNEQTALFLDSATYRNLDEAASPSSTKMWGIELLNGNSKGEKEVADAITRINQEMARLLGIEHLLLGADGSGSLALGSTKLSSFLLLIGSTLSELADAFKADWRNPTCELNGIPRELWPDLVPEDVDIADVEAVAAALRDLATAGAPLAPNDPAINEVRAKAGLSPAPLEDDLDPIGLALVSRGGEETESELDDKEEDV